MAGGFAPKSLNDILAGAPGRRARGYGWNPERGPKPLWAVVGGEAPYGAELGTWGHRDESPATAARFAQAAPSEQGKESGGAGKQQGGLQAKKRGLDPQYFLPAGKLEWPTDYPVMTEGFGVKNPDVRSGPHNGIDARAYRDSPIYAVDDGTVINVYHRPRGGNQIRIQHPDGYVSGYAHTGPIVEPGQRVRRGEVIGFSDGSGGVTPHLHFTYRPGPGEKPVDPYPFLPQVPIKK